MTYQNIIPAVFLARPNRFIAEVDISGIKTVCHVKNTGRCRELLIPGSPVFIAESGNPLRKTKYDLISVVNIDSQAPNKVVGEWLREKGLQGEAVASLRSEYFYGHSRMDFYAETNSRRYLIEVKGCTLEEDGVARFPDAPTERGIRHLEELISARQNGYEAMAVFVIQMKGVSLFRPNWRTHAAFGEALTEAAAAGVLIKALDCIVTADSLRIDCEIPVSLDRQKYCTAMR